jgi:hypothetical protein
VPLVGIEQPPENTGKTLVPPGDSALSTELQCVIDAWPDLAESVRESILVLVAAGDRRQSLSISYLLPVRVRATKKKNQRSNREARCGVAAAEGDNVLDNVLRL